MGMPELTLEDLSERTGVEPRTLRSWVSEGLLSPPFRGGRGATYPAHNVERALAVRALKDTHGLSLAEIGRLFLLANNRQIREWAAGEKPDVAAPASARDYLRALRASSLESAPGFLDKGDPGRPALAFSRSNWTEPGFSVEGPNRIRHGPADLGRIEKLIAALQALLAAPAQRRARSMVWTRIEITPDLELAVRGDMSPAELHLFLQLADQLRALLTEGPTA